jgi:ankyrin repeat protein
LRTAIHLAAVSGHATVLEFLINNAPVEGRSELLSMKDRWGATPLDEAEHNDNQMCT